jgi:KDO2-lipid IV(A) lauroyltransferase
MQKSEPFRPSRFLSPRHWPTWIGLGLLRLFTLLPHRRLMVLGGLLGDLIYWLMESRRHVVTTNIDLCFPQLSDGERATMVREHFRNAGRAIFESTLSWWAPDARLRPLAHIHGLQHLEEAAADGKGVILLSAHFTCFELGARLLAMHHPFQFLYKPQRNNPLFEAYTTRLRLRHYLSAVSHRDLRGMAKGLKRKLTCWYLPDQDFGDKNSVFVPFMGIPTATVTATSRLAALTGARVVPYFPIRREQDGYDIYILPAFDHFPSGDDADDAARYNALLEEYVRQAPAQYLWLHKRFKTRPRGEPRVY